MNIIIEMITTSFLPIAILSAVISRGDTSLTACSLAISAILTNCPILILTGADVGGFGFSCCIIFSCSKRTWSLDQLNDIRFAQQIVTGNPGQHKFAINLDDWQYYRSYPYSTSL